MLLCGLLVARKISSCNILCMLTMCVFVLLLYCHLKIFCPLIFYFFQFKNDLIYSCKYSTEINAIVIITQLRALLKLNFFYISLIWFTCFFALTFFSNNKFPQNEAQWASSFTKPWIIFSAYVHIHFHNNVYIYIFIIIITHESS